LPFALTLACFVWCTQGFTVVGDAQTCALGVLSGEALCRFDVLVLSNLH
jgi:hypothetical protein